MCPNYLSVIFKKDGYRTVTTYRITGTLKKMVNRYCCNACGPTWSSRVQFYANEIYTEIVNLFIKKTALIGRFLRNSAKPCEAIYHTVL